MLSDPSAAPGARARPDSDPGRGPLRPLPSAPWLAAAAACGLIASWLIAELTPVPWWELDVVRALTEVPDGLAAALDPVMQLGTVVAPLGVAVVIGLVRRDLSSAVVTVLVGVGAWIGAKVLKDLVDRDRPISFLPDLVVREDQGQVLGYPSGHSAVAAATAVVVAAALPARLRWIVVVLAGVVGIARIVHGVHLPADVVGGWSLGVLVGLLGLAVVARATP